MLVAFDFDGTITDRDSLQDFVRRMRGWGVCLKAYLACAPRVARLDRGPARRQAIKARFLASALAGLDRRQLEDLAQAYVRRHLPRLLRPEMLERLREHCRRGDTVVLVSASPLFTWTSGPGRKAWPRCWPPNWISMPRAAISA